MLEILSYIANNDYIIQILIIERFIVMNKKVSFKFIFNEKCSFKLYFRLHSEAGSRTWQQLTLVLRFSVDT